jgi:hypothetical protein
VAQKNMRNYICFYSVKSFYLQPEIQAQHMRINMYPQATAKKMAVNYVSFRRGAVIEFIIKDKNWLYTLLREIRLY